MIKRLTLQAAVFWIILLTGGESFGQDLQVTYKVKVENRSNVKNFIQHQQLLQEINENGHWGKNLF